MVYVISKLTVRKIIDIRIFGLQIKKDIDFLLYPIHYTVNLRIFVCYTQYSQTNIV